MNPEQFELLIRIAEKQDLMYGLLSNHLQHHFLYNLAMLTAVVTLTGVIIKLLITKNKKAK